MQRAQNQMHIIHVLKDFQERVRSNTHGDPIKRWNIKSSKIARPKKIKLRRKVADAKRGREEEQAPLQLE